jgi:hypothetical protein
VATATRSERVEVVFRSTRGGSYVAYVDFDLANEHVPVGSEHLVLVASPSRARLRARAVRLVVRFITNTLTRGRRI